VTNDLPTLDIFIKQRKLNFKITFTALIAFLDESLDQATEGLKAWGWIGKAGELEARVKPNGE